MWGSAREGEFVIDFFVYVFIALIGLLVFTLLAGVIFSFYMGWTYSPQKDEYLDTARWIDGQ